MRSVPSSTLNHFLMQLYRTVVLILPCIYKNWTGFSHPPPFKHTVPSSRRQISGSTLFRPISRFLLMSLFKFCASEALYEVWRVRWAFSTILVSRRKQAFLPVPSSTKRIFLQSGGAGNAAIISAWRCESFIVEQLHQIFQRSGIRVKCRCHQDRALAFFTRS